MVKEGILHDMENIILNLRRDTCSGQYIIIFTKLQPMG